MTKIKAGILSIAMLLSLMVNSQSLDEARKMLGYERYATAADMLEKLAAANPTVPEVQYWLGQSYLLLNQTEKAREVYRKALETNGSNPLLIVGSGHIELIEGKINEARDRFETAINLSKTKDVNVLNAIGRANADKNGDIDYAIAKLTLATTLKGFKEPDVYINMGNAYRKRFDGSGAVRAYQNALTVDPNYAMAHYRIGKVYLTQGKDQEALFTKNFEDAITADPKFAPAFYDLYAYFFFRDVTKARNYFNQYKEVAEKGAALDYEEASLFFAAGESKRAAAKVDVLVLDEYKTALAKADALLAQYGENADLRLYRLKGYSFQKLGEYGPAFENLQLFINKASPEQIVPDNWLTAAEVASKLPERQAEFDLYINKAIEADTTAKGKVEIAKKAIDIFKKATNQAKVAEWAIRVMNLNANPSKTEIYNAGYENLKAGNYLVADSLFDIYKGRYPDEIFGYYWSFRSLSVVDSTMELGLAIPDVTRFIELAEADKVKNKSTLIIAYGYMAGYQANVVKNFETAIAFLDRIIAIDPANADATRNKDILQKALSKKTAKPAGG